MTQDKNILGDSCIPAKFHPFIQAGHSKTIGAVFCKDAGQFYSTMSIGIGLDDRSDTYIWTYMFPDYTHIMSCRIQINLCPKGAARKIFSCTVCINHILYSPHFPFWVLCFSFYCSTKMSQRLMVRKSCLATLRSARLRKLTITGDEKPLYAFLHTNIQR